MLNDAYRLLASVTVVRELYDAEKNVYDVLEKFIGEIIIRRRLYKFSAAEITTYLNDDYSFQLSESVVRTSLRRMKFPKSHGEYICSDLEKLGNNVNIQIDESEENNKRLFSKLFLFLENRLKRKIVASEKGYIRQSFCDFLLQDSLGESNTYTQYFHEFILTIENDPTLMNIIQIIKEGTLIYEGIRYSSNINETGSWTSKICLVLDTEILFSMGGYNSTLFQTLYTELDKYIKEINRACPNNAPKIRLCYFPETRKEINYYFESAERIVRGLDVLDPTKDAMGQILNNCEKASDVQSKKALFFEKLRSNNVTVMEQDFYDVGNKDNTEFNLEDKGICETYRDKWREKEENIHKSLVCLSHINILRKGISNTGFENCGYIFLTATGRTLKLSCVPELLKDGEVPLATSFDFLINRFWFKLNKGFGVNRTPRTMDMVMRARNILSSIINGKAAEKYDTFKMQYESSIITKEEFCALNNDLRSHLKTPSEVDKDTIGEAIDDLERWNMEEVLEAQRKKDLELEKANNTINQLSTQLGQSINAQKDLKTELSTVQSELENTRQEHNLEKARLNADIESEKAINRKNSKDIECLKKQLEEEQKRRKDAEYKKALIKYYITCSILGFFVILGIGGFVWAFIREIPWAKAVSALIEISSIIIILVSKIKEKKPKKENT